MDSDFDERLELDHEKIKNAVRLQLPIEITTYTLPRNMEIYIRKILQLFLRECHQEHMFDPLDFCLGELLTNAKKANTKRIYFQEKNLDINNEQDYQKGMETFKQDTLNDIHYYLNLQKKAGLYIKLFLQIKGEKIRVEIINNSVITQTELNRIKTKIDLVQQYDSIAEVYQNALDQSEGAGLGIIIIILMLRKIGLSKENYQVIATDKETITRIILPCNSMLFAGNEILTYEFVKLQESLPIFEDTFEQVKAIVSEPTIDRTKLTELFIQDTTLATHILKSTLKKDSTDINLKKVLDKLDDQEIKTIFNFENNELKIVEKDESNIKLWEHSKKVAFYAYNFVKNYTEAQTALSPEEAYTLGLLSNLGSLLLLTSSDEQKKYVKDLCAEFEESEKIADIFYIGNCSQFITMIYTKKIGLMETFSAILGCWNYNDMYPKAIKEASNIIYLAEIMQYYNEEVVEYYQIDKNILNSFNITSEEQFSFLLNKLNENL